MLARHVILVRGFASHPRTLVAVMHSVSSQSSVPSLNRASKSYKSGGRLVGIPEMAVEGSKFMCEEKKANRQVSELTKSKTHHFDTTLNVGWSDR